MSKIYTTIFLNIYCYIFSTLKMSRIPIVYNKKCLCVVTNECHTNLYKIVPFGPNNPVKSMSYNQGLAMYLHEDDSITIASIGEVGKTMTNKSDAVKLKNICCINKLYIGVHENGTVLVFEANGTTLDVGILYSPCDDFYAINIFQNGIILDRKNRLFEIMPHDNFKICPLIEKVPHIPDNMVVKQIERVGSSMYLLDDDNYLYKSAFDFKTKEWSWDKYLNVYNVRCLSVDKDQRLLKFVATDETGTESALMGPIGFNTFEKIISVRPLNIAELSNFDTYDIAFYENGDISINVKGRSSGIVISGQELALY